jgi:predicted Zn-dependent protease with MMP-like domain
MPDILHRLALFGSGRPGNRVIRGRRSGQVHRVDALAKQLIRTAEAVVKATREELPANLRTLAAEVPVVFEPRPDDALLAEGWEPDLLGMFSGDGLDVGPSEAAPAPRQILLFYENLWDFAEEDEAVYREEVRITYLHELGHYFGWDEDDLEERGLE